MFIPIFMICSIILIICSCITRIFYIFITHSSNVRLATAVIKQLLCKITQNHFDWSWEYETVRGENPVLHMVSHTYYRYTWWVLTGKPNKENRFKYNLFCICKPFVDKSQWKLSFDFIRVVIKSTRAIKRLPLEWIYTLNFYRKQSGIVLHSF